MPPRRVGATAKSVAKPRSAHAAQRAIAIHEQASAMRRFNRFYTRHIGVLREGLLDSPYTLTESRVLYELAQRTKPTAAELAEVLDLDQGYLSRVLNGLARQKLLSRTRAAHDARHMELSLTAAGRRAFTSLNTQSHAVSSAILNALPAVDRQRVISAMDTIEQLLMPPREGARPFTLREPLPGELGYLVHRQSVLYEQEYGYGRLFEGLVAEVVAHFIANYDPFWERCWIAERDGQVVGSVMVVRKSRQVAKLRLLYVEPSARGLGVGRQLVQECLQFARQCGYRRMTLWTNSVLKAARNIYKTEGFVMVESHEHEEFGIKQMGETWEKSL